MNGKITEGLAGILNVIAAGAVMLVSFLVDLRFPISKGASMIMGMIIVVAGIALVLWAAVHIREAFLGEVEPRLDTLIQNGPYRYIRHPVYLGMTIALVGVTISLRSWPGLIGVFLLFLPSQIYRANLEEKALSSKFGEIWDDYAQHSGFFLPHIGQG